MVPKHNNKNFTAGIFLVFGTIVVAASSALYWSFSESFQKLDRMQAKNDSERAVRAYKDRFNSIEEKAADWSHWNDLYEFVNGRNDGWASQELTEIAIGGMGFDLVAILSEDREVKAAAHIESGKIMGGVDVPTFLKSETLWSAESESGSLHGIVMYRGLPALIVSRPIRDSSGRQPPKGRLVFIQQINAGFLDLLSKQILFPVQSVANRNVGASGEEGPLESMDSKSSLEFYRNIVVFHIGLMTIDGEDAGSLRIEIPREVSAFGRESARAIVGALIVASLLFFGLFVVIFRLSGAESNFKSALHAIKDLRQREAHLNALIDSVPGYVSWFDRESRYLGVNQRLARDCGLNRAEFVGKEIGSLSAQDLPDLKGRLRQFFSAELTCQQQTVEFEAETGKKRFVISMEKYNEGSEVVVVGLDMTASMESEMQAVRDRQSAIQASRLASLGEMAGGIAHEINNPLAIIQGVSRRIARNLQSEPAHEKVKPCLHQIDEMTRRIATIIQGLKSISRDGSLDPVWPVTVGSIIEQVKPLFLERYTASGIELRAIVGDAETIINCRQVQITQVLISLLQNSYEAIQACAERWVQVEIVTADKVLELAVIDSGRGIKAEVAANMMDPFFSTKEVGKGIGLSLSVAQSILSEHGGSLYYDEKAAHTRFVLRLPIYLAPAVHATAA